MVRSRRTQYCYHEREKQGDRICTHPGGRSPVMNKREELRIKLLQVISSVFLNGFSVGVRGG